MIKNDRCLPSMGNKSQPATLGKGVYLTVERRETQKEMIEERCTYIYWHLISIWFDDVNRACVTKRFDNLHHLLIRLKEKARKLRVNWDERTLSNHRWLQREIKRSIWLLFAFLSLTIKFKRKKITTRNISFRLSLTEHRLIWHVSSESYSLVFFSTWMIKPECLHSLVSRTVYMWNWKQSPYLFSFDRSCVCTFSEHFPLIFKCMCFEALRFIEGNFFVIVRTKWITCECLFPLWNIPSGLLVK